MDMSGEQIRKEFYEDFPYAVLFISFDGLRIVRFKDKQHMEKAYTELKECYLFIQKIETKIIPNQP